MRILSDQRMIREIFVPLRRNHRSAASRAPNSRIIPAGSMPTSTERRNVGTTTTTAKAKWIYFTQYLLVNGVPGSDRVLHNCLRARAVHRGCPLLPPDHRQVHR